MEIRALIEKLRQGLRKFGTAEGGNVVLTFALTLIPVMGFVGAAVDYSRATSAKVAMQAAVDSTALMLSKDAQGLTAAQIQTKANAYFGALFNRTEVTNIVLTPTFTAPTQGSFKLDVTVTGKVPTTFTKLFGQTNLNISTDSEVLWGVKKLEVALALDNTGSMASSQKMTNLKTAAHNLLTTLRNAAKTDGDVKVAIIPFTIGVNLGTAFNGNAWFDYDTIDCNGSLTGTGCAANNWKNYWDGCVRDRTYPYDVQDDPPNASVVATLFPAHNCGSLATLMPLSYDWTALNSKIDAMSPNGNTNVTIGLMWASHALTAQAPLSE